MTNLLVLKCHLLIFIKSAAYKQINPAEKCCILYSCILGTSLCHNTPVMGLADKMIMHSIPIIAIIVKALFSVSKSKDINLEDNRKQVNAATVSLNSS